MGESTPRLDAAAAAPLRFMNLGGSVMALILNGGTIRDSSGNDAVLLVPVAPTAGALATNHLVAINPPDSTPPVSTANASPGPNAHGWNKSDVTITITATDLAGSGVKQIQYTLSGAHTSGPHVVPGSTATVVISNEGTTNVSHFATDNTGNADAPKSVTIRLDKTLPAPVTFSAAFGRRYRVPDQSVSADCGGRLRLRLSHRYR
jgi:hypothetical protein